MTNRASRGQQRDKPFRDALRMEIAEAGADLKALRDIAKRLLEMAMQGDIQAIQQVADRLDGKPAQAIEHDGQVEHKYVIEVPAVIASSEEWERQHSETIQ